ncbi:MAG: uroporphyrinogen-III C-methyltransferase [Gammaproteobacteria bacterium]|jgi:uroporphyrin-3 C-methyltransferase|nr:uroporphyrinogen-III C-methyltransferase [Gammaproteobacteria bacterium]MDH3983047.1 uroporphyrinogen-III C-methyltransferase [Gammaproteobacteria bacterium]
MSDKNKEQDPLAADEEATPVDDPAAEEPVVEEPVAEEPVAEEPVGDETVADEVIPQKPRRERSGNSVAWLAFLVSIIAFAAAGYTAWQGWLTGRDTSASDNYARLENRLASSDASLAELEAKIAALDAEDPDIEATLSALRQELDERVRLLSSLPARMSTLEGSVASLAGVSEGARDAWILAESEYYMQIANAQLQLANNPHLAALALKMADERIVQLANPALTDVRRAISDELAALDVMEKPDIEGATLTLASLARVVDSLPLAAAAETDDETTGVDPELSGAGRAWASVKNAMSGLVKVTPPERAKLVQMSPDAEYFLRNNIALQLQSARLALLRGEQAIFEQSLDDTSALLNDYFDAGSTQVIGALATIAEIRGHVFSADVPDISESLRLLRQFRTLSENAQ